MSHDDEPWSPATSQPGEIYTPEGQIKQVGAFARGLTNHDPRAKQYRMSMMKPGLYLLGIVAFIGAAALVANLIR